MTREEVLCAVCGNRFEAGLDSCPFCRAAVAGCSVRIAGVPHRMVNLERGRPLVRQAIDRLDREIATSRLQGVRLLTFIHGYGSSGAGGAIRAAVRERLLFLRLQGQIEALICGEDFEGRSGRGRQLLRRFPVLASHRDLNRANPGITLVILPAGKDSAGSVPEKASVVSTL